MFFKKGAGPEGLLGISPLTRSLARWSPKKFGLIHFIQAGRGKKAARAAARTGPMVTLEREVVNVTLLPNTVKPGYNDTIGHGKTYR